MIEVLDQPDEKTKPKRPRKWRNWYFTDIPIRKNEREWFGPGKFCGTLWPSQDYAMTVAEKFIRDTKNFYDTFTYIGDFVLEYLGPEEEEE